MSGLKPVGRLGGVKESDDDLYEGFNNNTFGAQAMQYNNFESANQNAPLQAASILRAQGNQKQRMGTARIGTARMGTAAQRNGTARMGTAARAAQGEEVRPMTSIRAAGYTSAGKPGTAGMNQAGGLGPAPPLEEKKMTNPEDIAKEKEKEVNTLLEESAIANSQKKFSLALEKAKEAAKKERGLVKHRETNNLMEQVNIDLTYSVCFNLANQYQANEMYNEALNTYSLIVKNKAYSQSGRLRVNMGNIYYKQKKYPSAIKMYRMALDQIPNTGKEMRFKIMRNIGNAFVKLGNYQDAIMSYENIMEGRPDFQTGFNLIVCYFALDEKIKMKRSFTKMLSTKEAGMDIAAEEENEVDEEETGLEEEDELKSVMKERRHEVTQYIVQAAKLIAPKIETEFVDGFHYVIEQLRTFKEYADVASDMEISKAVYFLKQKKVPEAKQTLLAFGNKDRAEHNAMTLSRANTNLCFIFFLEGDLASADKYGTYAISAEMGDRYNAKALVNKANCVLQNGKNAEDKGNFDEARERYEEAKELYIEGIGVEADCIEAIFNLGLCLRTKARLEQRLGDMESYKGGLRSALNVFVKHNTILPESPECNYNIATIYDELSAAGINTPEGAECAKKAVETYKRLIAQVKSDAGVLARYGNLLARDDDETMAFNMLFESYRYYPADMDVISWLGAYFVKSEMYEKAMEYFQKAAQIQPKEVKWMLMVASCHRRIGAYQQALRTYEDIHSKHPDNIECLEYLIRICKELGMTEKAGTYQYNKGKAEDKVVARMTKQRVDDSVHHQHAGFRDESGGMSGGRRDNYQGYGEFGGMQDTKIGMSAGNSTSVGRIDTDSVAEMAVAERANKGGGKMVIKKGRADDEDDWGGDELGDDLLPGM